MNMKNYVKERMRYRLTLWVNQCAKWGDMDRYLWMFEEYAAGCCDTYNMYSGGVWYLNFDDIEYIFKSLVEYRKGVR